MSENGYTIIFNWFKCRVIFGIELEYYLLKNRIKKHLTSGTLVKRF